MYGTSHSKSIDGGAAERHEHPLDTGRRRDRELVPARQHGDVGG
jgi:hypothetical protein